MNKENLNKYTISYCYKNECDYDCTEHITFEGTKKELEQKEKELIKEGFYAVISFPQIEIDKNKRKTVQELFNWLDKNTLIECYCLKYSIDNDDYMYSLNSIEEKARFAQLQRLKIGQAIDNIRMHNITQKDETAVLFAARYKEFGYEDKGNTTFDTFIVYPSDVIEKIKRPEWTNEGENTVRHYGYDFSPINEICGYEIANASLEDYSPYEIAVEVLEEVTFFGYEEEYREERCNNIIEELNESMKKIEEAHEKGEEYGIPADDVFEKMHQEMLNECIDENEKEYIKLERSFSDKVRELEKEYNNRIIEENKKITENLYKREFLENV